jgi:two-component system, OmpR family, KDP operon response regulator KdpE
VTTVLVVDDDPAIQRTLAIGLRARGYDVLPARDGRTAVEACHDDEPDVVLLDLGLPDLSGVEVLRKVREWSQVPVIVLSARHGSDDKVEALDVGADDYVTKPFGMDELLARLRAAVRRSATEQPPQPVVTDDFTVDLAAKQVWRDGAEVRLTPTEWRLLEALVTRPGRLVPQRQLLAEAWGPGYTVETNYLRVFVAGLRRKLEPDPSRPRYLLTEPGMGYRFVPPAG